MRVKRYGIICKRTLTSESETIPSFIKGNIYYANTIDGIRNVNSNTMVYNELNQPHILGIWFKHFITE